jgi:hypothetical protein
MAAWQRWVLGWIAFRGVDVVEVLERVGRQVGFPATIRVDQGTEFVSRDLDLWAYQRGVMLDFSRLGIEPLIVSTEGVCKQGEVISSHAKSSCPGLRRQQS